jgi:hypothetical protein
MDYLTMVINKYSATPEPEKDKEIVPYRDRPTKQAAMETTLAQFCYQCAEAEKEDV